MPLLTESRILRYWPAGVILLAGLGISGVLGWQLHRRAMELDQQRLGRIGKLVLDELDGRVEKSELILRQAQDYFSAQQHVSSTLFVDWCRKHELSWNLAWAYGLVLYTNRNAERWRESLPADPQEWTAEHSSRFRNLVRRSRIPLELGLSYKSAPVAGFLPDLFPQPLPFPGGATIKGALETALASNRVRTTGYGRMAVLQDGTGATGAALVVPLYFPERDLHLQAATVQVDPYVWNWNLCRGVLVMPIDYDKLERAIWSRQPKEVQVDLFASMQPSAVTCLTGHGHEPNPSPQPVGFQELIPWRMYGRDWSIRLRTLPSFNALSPRRMAWLASASGIGITLLSAALIGVTIRARIQQESMLAEVVEARDALAAADRERERLGHDLHDGAIQSLYAVQLGLTRTSEKVAETIPAAADVLEQTRKRVDDVITELRQYILRHEPPRDSGPGIGLHAVLTGIIETLRPAAEARLTLEGVPDAASALSVSQVVQLAQITRSALANSLRHSRARHIQLVLRNGGDTVCLEIIDDGTGFDPRITTEGVGMKAMRSRAEEAGGTFRIDSRPGGGTRVTVLVPVAPVDVPEGN